MNEKRTFSFETAKFFQIEYSFEMIHPDTENACPDIGKHVTIKAKGHHIIEAKSRAKKTCSISYCQATYIFK